VLANSAQGKEMLQRVGGAKKNRKIRKMKIFPNVLKAHSIENFSGCLCQKVYEDDLI
jgi:hypothetical protein